MSLSCKNSLTEFAFNRFLRASNSESSKNAYSSLRLSASCWLARKDTTVSLSILGTHKALALRKDMIFVVTSRICSNDRTPLRSCFNASFCRIISFISLLKPKASLGKKTFISSVSTTCFSCSLYRIAKSCVCFISASRASIFLLVSAELFAPSLAASYSSCIDVRYLYILSCSSIFWF